MKQSVLFLLTLAILTTCTTNEVDYDGFVTRLGDDTLAVESFKLDGNEFVAEVVVRSPRTILTKYIAKINDVGGIDSLMEYRFDPKIGYNGYGTLARSIVTEGDSLNISFLRDGETRSI
ncbi:MAG: DUF2911 domain-containing protein, partial [Balneolaceae bacterium]